ncbi:hypothetical protein QQY66_37600 [Streptomyces sp. DG2A-72]|uniref:hypothetical protein n=1 Tax=Streptomyces sp. DG2A-72 TaxID=3051386 RepID=UPI00265C7E29|nr:hypothetical protein [Streptomyces sp. DG2A-72]MDO0937156.1 hypothetical protein [Streptomyces sp. DG2A-72]
MIQPESIPLFTGDLGQLEQHIDALREEADGIRRAGGEAHRQFQGLSAFYEAPEAEDLFASTAPARNAADSFGDKVATVADALRAYAAEVAPIAKRLEHLQSQATAFVAGLKTDNGEFDENWTDDADKVEKHQALMHDVALAQAAFTAAEIACNNKITALVGGTQYVMNTGAKQFIPRGAELYGYSAEVLDHAKELPWGTPVTQSHDWWDPDDLGYYAKSFFWDGLIVDNVWGTVDGLATLFGVHGGDKAKQAWEGLVRVVVGAETYLMESGGQKPSGVFASDFAQESKGQAKEFAKSFVAWDMWKENPARAAATVVFNGLTLGAGPLKVASVGKAGTAAKVASTVAKVGDAIDPIGAAVRVTGHAMPRIAQVTENLRGMNDIPDLRAPHSVLELSDGSKVRIENGEFIPLDRDGNAIGDTPRRELPADVRAVQNQTPPQRELSGVGAGSRASEATAHVGDGTSPTSGHGAAGAGETSSGHSRDIPDGTGSADSHGSGSGGGGGDAGGPPLGGGSHLPDGPMEPRGNLPDGSWEGPQGLRLSPEENAATGQFMDRALATEPRITEAIRAASGHVEHGQLNGLEYRLKGEDSLKRKVATVLLEDARLTPDRALANIRDSLRYTVEIPTRDYSHGVQQAVDELRARGFENVTFKNTWERSGYKGINSTWRDPSTGQIFEVQFHTPESFVAKMDTHVLYEKGRLPGISSDEFAAIQAAQNDLFDKVPVPRGADSIRLDHDLHGTGSADAPDVDLTWHGDESVHGNGPPPELTPEQRTAHDAHLNDLARQHSNDFDQLKQDPDHKGKVKPSEMDEARVALDLRETGKVPTDIQRPPGANQGDLYSPSIGEFYDIKGVHSDWPPLNNVRDKSLPFKGAYNPANNQGWVRKLEDQIVTRGRIVIIDMRNANQAAIDDVKSIVEQHGWSDRVVWYP